MIDWSKVGPANSPQPSTPDTTAPVAPAAPGGLTQPVPPQQGAGLLPGLAPLGSTGTAQGQDFKATIGNKYTPLTQEQVDQLDPGQRVMRGLDFLGDFLFGEQSLGNGFAPKDALAGLIGMGGDAVGAVGDLTIVKPIEAVAGAAARVPLGWLPGGADEGFGRIGEWAKANSPEIYAEWQAVQTAADADILYGGNMKADFNIEFAKWVDDQQENSQFGFTPVELAMGREGVGSLGGAASHAIQGWLGVLGNGAQRGLGELGVFNPDATTASYDDMKSYYDQKAAGSEPILAFGAPTDAFEYAQEQIAAGKMTEAEARAYVEKSKTQGDRLEETVRRYESGQEVSDTEKTAVEAYLSGAWSADHAKDFMVQRGQGITRNPIGQILGSLATDPLTYATLGTGAVAKAGVVGGRVATMAGQGATLAERLATATTTYEKLAVTVNAVQKSQMGPVFRIARGLVDPFAVYKPSTVQNAVVDLRNGIAVLGFERAYGPKTVANVRALGRELGMTSEFDSAIASYSIDQANLMIARQVQRDMLSEGLGIDLITESVDDVIEPIARNATRDALTDLTDHMLTVSKNTFTAEEQANLAGRLAASFGGDVETWTGRMAKMSHDERSALHAITYKSAEKDFMGAVAKVDVEAYTGTLPLRQMVLMSADTLDNITAERIIENIRDVLKAEADDAADLQRIAMATAEWNAQAMRYPAMANLGYAPGGKEQLQRLVDELEKKVQSGAITRRALPEELNDPALRPIRDMLDRHSVPDASIGLRPADDVAPVFTPGPGVAKAPRGMATSTIKNGGGTFDVATGKAVKPGSGYGVGIGAQGKVVANTKAAIEEAYIEVSKTGTPHIGTWVNPEDGMVYVDPTQVIDDLDSALAIAQARGEKAIFDFSTFEDIPVPAKDDLMYGANGKRALWKVGFRPDEEVAWGLKEDPNTGRYVIDRDPTISHVVDAVPGRQPFSDTTRNALGQIIGRSKAERLNKPIESIEAYTNTLRDVVTGRRLVKNVELRFERIAFDAGVPAPLAKTIFAKAREVAALDYSTIRGVAPRNVWKEIADDIPRDLVLKDGSHLNVHNVMDMLLVASEGDLRIMGLTSVLTQRIRNRMRQAGLDPANIAGQVTVTAYNKLRYSFNPTFVIQRITDAPYYSILYGVTPLGRSKLSGANAELKVITDNLGRTQLGRDFSMDMPEYALRSNFTQGIKSSMQDMGLRDLMLDKIVRAPDEIIASQMTNMLHARLGDIVKGTLDNVVATLDDPTLDAATRAELMQHHEVLTRSFEDWRRIYSENAGRILDDNEVGLEYIKDQLMAWKRHVVNADGTLDFDRLIHEGEMFMPDEIAGIEPIRPDQLAQRLGYTDSAALRRDVTGHIEKVGGEYVLVKGEHDIAWLEEKLRAIGANPGYVRRATAYYGETWDDFWTRLSRGTDEGGLDISPHYAAEAKRVISIWADQRSMDPWEYLSGVMAANLGANDIDTAMGQLVSFLKSGKAKQPIEEWTKMFRAHLDLSAQRTLLDEFEAASGGVAGLEQMFTGPKPGAPTQVAVKAAPGKPARTVAGMPKGYTTEPGYMYRVETLAKARGGWPKRTGVSTEATPFYFDGSPGQGVFRAKLADDPKFVDVGRHGAGGKDRLTKRATKPTEIEMLDESGNWVPVGDDPMDTIMAKSFPEAVRQRILTGQPHPNPEIEAYLQHFTKWVQGALGEELSTRTRADLRRLVEAVPTNHASSFNRSQALVVSLLKNKIEDSQVDIFRLAEMQTKRNVLERSLNHPLFGLYPASYMWGKVLPETVKFLAKNPYGATYDIANVQRSIAIQREYDPELEEAMSTVDRSSTMFLLDYLTPGLPWSDHEARMSPLFRGLIEGKDPGAIWDAEISTMSPNRWIAQFRNSIEEIPGAIDALSEDAAAPQLPGLDALTGGAPIAAPGGATPPESIAGPTKAAALAPLLMDDLSRLRAILLEGQDAAEE